MKTRWMKWIMVLGPLGVGYAGETFNWDTENNTVTYTWASTFGQGNTTVNLSQFNAATAASQEGIGSASDYVLTKAVLTLNGSLSVAISYENTTASGVNVSVSAFEYSGINGASSFTYQGQTSSKESYHQELTHNFGYVNAGQKVSTTLNAAGTGAVSAQFLEALEGFIGSGTFATTVNFDLLQFNWSVGDGTTTAATTRNAEMSVMYYYEAVPEPSTFALCGLGAAALLVRRRRMVSETKLG